MNFNSKKCCSKNHFLLTHANPEEFTQGRWTAGNKQLNVIFQTQCIMNWNIYRYTCNPNIVSFISIPDERVTISYLIYKIIISVYLMATYVICHVKYASSYCGENGTNEIRKLKATTGVKNNSVLSRMDSDCGDNRSDWPYFWLYLTNWSYTLIILSFSFSTILVIIRFIEEKRCLHRDVEENCVTTSPSYKGYYFNYPSIIL